MGRNLINQLTFEILRTNPTVSVEDSPRLKKQAKMIYARLQHGPLWTRDLRAMACQYNARICELRRWLQEFEMTIDITGKYRDGNNRYELRPFAGSKYQAQLMARQAKLNSS